MEFPDHDLVIACDINDNEEPIKDFYDLLLDTKKDMTVFLNSDGGHVQTALALGGAISIFQGKGYKLTIHVGGIAHSAATLLVQFANRRIIQPHTTFRIHEISSTYEGEMTRSQIVGETKIYDNFDANYLNIIAMRTGIKRVKWNELIAENENDWLIDSEAIMQYKLADEVLNYPPAFYWQDDIDSNGNVVPASQHKPQPQPRRRRRPTSSTST